MARIRSIKPEFWTDDKIVSISPFARLLFLGLLNFCDDGGNIEASPTQLKMRILPADSVNVHELLSELTSVGLVREYSVRQTKYLNIKGFNKHQVINRPSKTRLPPPPLTEHSLLEGKGKDLEGNGKERKGSGSKTFVTTDNANAASPLPDGGRAATPDYEQPPPIKAPDLPPGEMSPEELIAFTRALGGSTHG